MTLLRRYWLALLLVALGFVLGALTYDRLPERMAVHWGLDGNVNGWMSRPMGALFLPLVMLLIVVLMICGPDLRRGADKALEPRVYPTLVTVMAGFMLFMQGLLLLLNMGSPLSIHRLGGAAVGLLIAIIGNYMGKVPRNRYVGIRLPWTLESDEVWERTHRFAAPILVAGGLVLFVFSLARPDIRTPLPMLVILGVTVVIPVVKSYLIWRSVRSA
jgi:uncharacterized membrane protein